jgi:nucleoside-diphosphate-sugar epimerase
MIIAITGSSSLLGKNLVHKLIENEYSNIRILINKTKASIAHPNVRFFNSSENGIDKFLDNADVLYHLAFDRYNLSNNISLCKNLIREIERHHISKIILCSTVSVYGILSNKVIDEKTQPNPKSPYAKTKLHIEELFIETLNDKADLIIIRPSVILYPDNVSVLNLANDIRNKKFVKLFIKRLLLKNRHKNYVSAHNVVDALIYILHNFNNMRFKVYNVTQDFDRFNDYGEIENILYATILNSKPKITYGIPKNALDYLMRKIPLKGSNDFFYSSSRLIKEGFVFKRALQEDLIEIAESVKDYK